jgi:adenosylcobinamide kinase/adenosylcobinamide-phosphate guanylyltransferase
MTRLLITRHATAVDQHAGRLPGPDLPLASDGQQQAQALAVRLQAFAPAAVYTSPALRAWQTGAIIAEQCQVPLTVHPGLRELDFGAWAGQMMADVVAAHPAAHQWFTDPSTGGPPGGETIAAVAERTYAVLSALSAPDPDRVVVVGHAGSLRLALARGLGMPLGNYWRLPLDCASLSIVGWTPDGILLERLNDTLHLVAEPGPEQERRALEFVRGYTTLVLGGARSGKSRWAEQLARRSGQPVLYIATATAGDAEMTARIAAHRSQRPTHWRTVEEPERLLATIQDNALPGDTVVVDCLTLWVSNVMLQMIDPDHEVDTVSAQPWATVEQALLTEVQDLITLGRERGLRLILVSNEVGMGVVPATTLGRHFRDILGRINQVVAHQADATVLIIAGMLVDLSRVGSRPRPGG